MRSELGLSDRDFVVGTVARLVPIKNHALIVESASRLAPTLPDPRFVFVRDGFLRDELEERVRRLGMGHLFRFTGWRADTPDLLTSFDVFAMVSRNEGMGGAFVEAQAAGLPVIGSRVGGVPEVLVEAETGFLVEPDDARRLAELIRKLYTRRALLRQMGKRCRSGSSIFGISPFGEVYPCIHLPVALGCLRNRPLAQIWRGAKAHAFREEEACESAVCRRCAWRSHCARCPGMAWAEKGAWQGSSPSLCARARALGTQKSVIDYTCPWVYYCGRAFGPARCVTLRPVFTT